jgi:glutathione peroxidase
MNARPGGAVDPFPPYHAKDRFSIPEAAMRFLTICCLAAGVASAVAAEPREDKKVTALDRKMTGIDGKDVDLSTYKGKVVLFVNVASQCGFTPQYEGLQKLYDTHAKAGLVVIGVPANDFGKQEPGTDEEIAKFCQANYKVTFPMMGKVVVKGEGQCPLYKFLTEKETNPKHAGAVKWNFEKFLIARDGSVAGRYLSSVDPSSEELVKAIQVELEKK